MIKYFQLNLLNEKTSQLIRVFIFLTRFISYILWKQYFLPKVLGLSSKKLTELIPQSLSMAADPLISKTTFPTSDFKLNNLLTNKMSISSVRT